jgi:hypothetical protein
VSALLRFEKTAPRDFYFHSGANHTPFSAQLLPFEHFCRWLHASAPIPRIEKPLERLKKQKDFFNFFPILLPISVKGYPYPPMSTQFDPRSPKSTQGFELKASAEGRKLPKTQNATVVPLRNLPNFLVPVSV